MLSITTLATVAWVGVVGPSAPRLEHQLTTLLSREIGAEELALPTSAKDAIALRRPTAGHLVRSLDADAVLVGRLTIEHRVYTLRLLIYDRQGRVHGLFDIPLGQPALDRLALQMVRNEVLPLLRPFASEPVAKPTPPQPQQPEEPQEPAEQPGEPPLPPPPPVAKQPVDQSMTKELGPDEYPGLSSELAVGFGVLGRNFQAAPRTVPGYQSQPVGAVRLDGEVRPLSFLNLGFAIDRALSLSTDLGNESAPTTLSRWQATAHLVRQGATWLLAGGIGFGNRTFSIDSKNAARSPDGDYGYLVLSGRGQMQLGSMAAGALSLAYEPVVSGQQPTASMFGNAGRWGIEAGGDLEFYPARYLLLRAHGGWQRFTWSWAQAGVRGSGGATDDYFDAVLAIGVRYSPIL